MLRARAHELDQSGDLGFIVGVVFCALSLILGARVFHAELITNRETTR